MASPFPPVAPDNDYFNQLKDDYQDRSITKGFKTKLLTKRDATLIRLYIGEMQSAKTSARNGQTN
jgi:hypothetical protein